MDCLGLGKTLFNSSACLIGEDNGQLNIEIALTERITRKKASGVWPELAIRKLAGRFDPEKTMIGENRDVITPSQREDILHSVSPFYDHLKREALSLFSRHFNPRVEFVTHHMCHAMAALIMSPFAKSVIVVIDGAGTDAADFPGASEETNALGPKHEGKRAHEECTVYLQDGGSLKCVYKNWQYFSKSKRHPEHFFSEGLGTLYEKSAEYVFNSKRSAGKVMGLASYGNASPIAGRESYLENLDWTKAFSGKGKAEWESSDGFKLYGDIAATVQSHFEESVKALLVAIREKFPAHENLILTGGCALNCTSNRKIAEADIFKELYVPPFPGDESISLGAASYLYHVKAQNSWMPLNHENQHGFFGPLDSAPLTENVARAFRDFEIMKPRSITEYCAGLLQDGLVIAWFQGRSESGPRALGNRSILARPDIPGLKNMLNSTIKFRESFRPYGSSCLHEYAHEYFDVPSGFNSPYMSFAVRTRNHYRDLLKEITHVDGTSRIQTVRRTQNAGFYDLLHEFGKRAGFFCLLNTSLNIMGEPIVETLEDARNFLCHTPVHGIAVGDFFVKRGS